MNILDKMNILNNKSAVGKLFVSQDKYTRWFISLESAQEEDIYGSFKRVPVNGGCIVFIYNFDETHNMFTGFVLGDVHRGFVCRADDLGGFRLLK